MQKSGLILSSATLLSAAFSTGAFAVEKQKQQPNILFIMSDDHDSKAISAYGSG